MTSDLPHAGFIRRTMALIYDFFLLLGITLAYGALITLIRKMLGSDTLEPTSLLTNVATLLGLWGCCSLFYIWCWRRSGQTLGMKTWRLELTSADAEKPTLRQCWIRCVTATFANGCCVAGLLWCLVDKNRNALQDYASNTRILLLPKAEKSR
ncbi:MAG: RDD family protein [bacterium]